MCVCTWFACGWLVGVRGYSLLLGFFFVIGYGLSSIIFIKCNGSCADFCHYHFLELWLNQPSQVSPLGMWLVRITSWYLNFNGSHFGLPPSEIHRMTGLPPKIVWTMTYSHRPHWALFVQRTLNLLLLALENVFWMSKLTHCWNICLAVLLFLFAFCGNRDICYGTCCDYFIFLVVFSSCFTSRLYVQSTRVQSYCTLVLYQSSSPNQSSSFLHCYSNRSQQVSDRSQFCQALTSSCTAC